MFCKQDTNYLLLDLLGLGLHSIDDGVPHRWGQNADQDVGMRWSAAPKPLSASREDPRPVNQMVGILRDIRGKAFVLMDSQDFITSQRQTRVTLCEPLRTTPIWRDPGPVCDSALSRCQRSASVTWGRYSVG